MSTEWNYNRGNRGWRTTAEAVREEAFREGYILGKKLALLRLMRLRFGPLPAGMEQVIEESNEIERLEQWFDRAATAETLEQVGITTATPNRETAT